jgi:indolepyruvate ferredoxin oxidoreductase, beta subunit
MSTRPHNILIAALGGEGGGVLADWIVSAATIAGYPIQSTSIPGVAQRTGATTYYLELYPQTLAELRGARPILALTPTPGDVDVVIASELVEAGRAMQNGYVTPARTTLIASLSRVYAIGERSAMADGRFDNERIVAAARDLARSAVLFDVNELARSSGSPLNAILFGALIASQALPLDRAMAEAAIRHTGKAADSNLRGFALGFEQAGRTTDAAKPVVEKRLPAKPAISIADFPLPAQETISHGVVRLTDYQGRRYAQLFLDRLKPIALLEQGAGGTDCSLTIETARYLALWMSYEDVIRVADLKVRTDRRTRIRREVHARDTDIVRVVDFLKPGLEELCSVLPAGLGRAIYGFASKRGWQRRLNVGMHIRSTNVSGFLLLRLLAGLRWWRPHSWRFQEEQARIQKWLAAIAQAAAYNLALANEIAACGQIMKGYGDTHARAVRNFDLIAETYFHNSEMEPAALAKAIAAAHKAALADPEGESLAAEIASSSVSSGKAQRPFVAAAE